MKVLSIKKLFEKFYPSTSDLRKQASFDHGYQAAKNWYEKGYRHPNDTAEQSYDEKAFKFGSYVYEVENNIRQKNSNLEKDLKYYFATSQK